MEDIKKYIQSKLNNIEAELKQAKSNKLNFIAQKNQLLDMLFLIKMYEKYDISRKNIDKIVVLPNTKTDISEYRLMEDNDLLKFPTPLKRSLFSFAFACRPPYPLSFNTWLIEVMQSVHVLHPIFPKLPPLQGF